MGKTLEQGRKIGSGRKISVRELRKPFAPSKVLLSMPPLVLFCNSHFGEQLSNERIRAGLSQVELAAIMGCSSSNLSHFEMGDNTFGNGSLQTVFKYAKALGYDEIKFKL